MRSHGRVGRRVAGLLMLMTTPVTGSLCAQSPRDSLVAAAFAEFDAAQRVQLLVTALDPALGPPGETWATGVQLLAQTLVDEGEEVVAAAWLRWALRLAPDFPADTVQFLPRVIAAYRAAQDVVLRTRSPGDSLVTTTWRWPGRESRATMGQLVVTAPAIAAPVSTIVLGVGPLRPGESVALPPGSHTVRAVAPGYDSVQVTRETLPGVTTALEFQLRALVALGPAPGPETPEPPAAPELQRGRGGRFPWVVVGLGAAGVGALVAILAGGGGDGGGGSSTGGITISFPNP